MFVRRSTMMVVGFLRGGRARPTHAKSEKKGTIKLKGIKLENTGVYLNYSENRK